MKLYRPTETTKFHIDRAWFEKNGMDFRIAVFKCLTPEQQERVGEPNAAIVYDYVNETTGVCETGEAFATCAGFLAYSLWTALRKSPDDFVNS